jgi:hypothetical protein
MLSVGRQMRGVFDEEEVAGRDILWKLLLECRWLPTMPSGMVWKMLHYQERVGFPYQQIDRRGGVRKRPPSGPPAYGEELGKKGKLSQQLLMSKRRRLRAGSV